MLKIASSLTHKVELPIRFICTVNNTNSFVNDKISSFVCRFRVKTGVKMGTK